MQNQIDKKIESIQDLHEKIKIIIDTIDLDLYNINILTKRKIIDGIKYLEDGIIHIKMNKFNTNVLSQINKYNLANTLDSLIKILIENIVEFFYAISKENDIKRINILYNKYNSTKNAIDSNINEQIMLNTDNLTNDEIYKILSAFENYTCSWDFFTELLRYLLKKRSTDPNASRQLLLINERAKEMILKDVSRPVEHKKINPPLTTYNLIPISKIMDIDEISQTIFKTKANNINDFKNICKDKKYDLIIIKKIFGRGVDYNITDLLDYTASKTYIKNNATDDGITKNTINRYNNIKYMGNTTNKLSIDYDHKVKNNSYCVILEELYPKKFHIMNTVFNNEIYFVLKSEIEHLLKDITSSSKTTSSINNYNIILNRNIIEKMFLDFPVDIEKMENKSVTRDIKQLHHDLKFQIKKRYKYLVDKLNPKNIADYMAIIHDNSISDLFLEIMTNAYIEILDNADINKNQIPELYSTFLYKMQIFYRDFNKKIHDLFVIHSKSHPNDFDIVFDKVLQITLNTIVTQNNNVYQLFIYKLDLLKLTLI